MNNVRIQGFKCFDDYTFEVQDITILAGSNGTGKSSFVQALLLIRSAIEKNVNLKSDLGYLLRNYEYENLVPLNQNYEMSLGTFMNIFNSTKGDGKVEIQINDNIFYTELPNENENISPFAIKVLCNIGKENDDIISICKKEFYYLNAERLGPRHILPTHYSLFPNCGNKGEFTAQVLNDVPFPKIDKLLRFNNTLGETLDRQTKEWLNFVCPGAEYIIESLGVLNHSIKLRNQNVSDFFPAPNVGFGISYSLPIIVTGLIAVPGSLMIVENPEAHLHPKGQSNIGYFLGKVANTGVKVIIETHSEHVVNGVRKALLLNENTTTDKLNIYFFEGMEEGGTQPTISKIELDKLGNMNKFPRDFFDQVQQDMAEIFNINKNIYG